MRARRACIVANIAVIALDTTQASRRRWVACRHAATQALEDLERAVTAHASSASVQDADDFAALLDRLSALLTTDDKADKQQNLAVALQSGALLRLLLMAQTEQLEDGSVVALLRLCTQCLQLLSIRDMFASKVCACLRCPLRVTTSTGRNQVACNGLCASRSMP